MLEKNKARQRKAEIANKRGRKLLFLAQNAKTRIFGLHTFAQKKLRLAYLSGRKFKKNTS